MALDDGSPLSDEEAFVSLYRRYRPQRFSELRGQDHVVRALRTAVRDGHVAHAYLFSGPRGTGKTSTARILAKALNCLNPDEGDPCGVCASCVEITKGSSMDVIELDAASNGTIEPVRDLIAHASLGSPGRRKVYIIDEVHMLGTGAANALLKTLEEPPSHVVFVLATTDPQKVPATIRSRTQHLEFRLLGAEVVEGLLRDVRDAAGLELDDEVVGLAVRKGRGSARDALSALDQVAASGETEDARPSLLGDVLEAMAEEDAAGALVALTALREQGFGPQQLAVEVVDDLRQSFLLRVAPDLAEVTGDARRRAQQAGEAMGLARVVRGIELLGRAQVDMRDAPDPLVILEVAVIRSSREDPGVDGLSERLARLERRLAELEEHGAPDAPQPAPVVAEVPEGERPSLGAYRRGGRSRSRSSAEPAAPSAEAAPAPAPAAPAEPDPVVEAPSPVEAAAPVGGAPSEEALLQAWTDGVLPQLKISVRGLFAEGRASVEGGTLRLGVPTEPYMKKCSEYLDEVRSLLSQELGPQARFELVVDPESGRRSAERREPASTTVGSDVADAVQAEDEAVEILEESIDFDDLAEGPKGSIATDLILDAFPGATEEAT